MNNYNYNNTLQTALHWIFLAEGGYGDHPQDRGGATHYGISLRFLKSKNQDINGDGAVDEADIRQLSREQAAEIYEQDFFNPLLRFNLSPMMTVALFDASVNMGERAAVRCLQKAVKVRADGIFGPKTAAAIAGIRDEYELLMAFHSQRAVFYTRITHAHPEQSVFLIGWFNRLNTLFLYLLEQYHD